MPEWEDSPELVGSGGAPSRVLWSAETDGGRYR